MMRCLDGEFNSILVARSKVASGIQHYRWRRGWDEQTIDKTFLS